MNRQISFRAKDIETGEWRYGLPQQNEKDDISQIVSCEPKRQLEAFRDSNLTWYDVAPETLGECTNLLDKNNKMIYEGDIIEIYIPTRYDELKSGRFGRRITAQIRFGGGAFWFDGEGFTECNWHFYNASDRKIVGNIFENSELLVSPRST